MKNAYSYWENQTFFNYDVIVIGSGIVGLTAAIQLKKQQHNLKVCVLEAGFLPSGASTKNAGFACFGSVSELIEQEKKVGSSALQSLIERRWKGLLKLRALLGDDKIDYQKLGGSEIFKNSDTGIYEKCVAKIEHYNDLLKDIVGVNAFSSRKDNIGKFGLNQIENLIFNQYEAQIDTGKMMYALIQYAQQLGVFVINNCKVKAVQQENFGVSVVCDDGNFSAGRTIVATNAFVKTLLPELDVKPGRGQVILTKPIKNLKTEGTFHYNQGYFYFRNIHDRILLGGGRNLDFEAETTTNLGLSDQIQRALELMLKEVILSGTPFKIEQRWSGIMAFGESLEPIVKEARENIFYAGRCNGMGVAIGSQMGEDVATLVLSSM